MFGNRATVVTHLNEDNDMNSLMRVIDNLQIKNQNTNTSGGQYIQPMLVQSVASWVIISKIWIKIIIFR